MSKDLWRVLLTNYVHIKSYSCAQFCVAVCNIHTIFVSNDPISRKDEKRVYNGHTNEYEVAALGDLLDKGSCTTNLLVCMSPFRFYKRKH